MTASPPQDSSFPVAFGMEYHFVSDTTLEYGEWLGLATVQPDSSVTYSLAACSQGYRYGYERRGDSILVRGLLDPAPEPPHPPDARIGEGGDLHVTFELPDTVVFRFTRSERVPITC
jgi:hypothetical protein